jgi:citrate lyase subunit beta/citryl-CoA lyase
MPGSNQRAIDKGRTLPVDSLILDLEDSVAPDTKLEARQRVVDALSAGGFGRREVTVRVNGLDTPWGHGDLVALARAGADAVVLPKIDDASQVRQAEAVLVGEGAPPELDVWVMMETARGLLRAEAIADATPRLAAFVMGTSDLARELHAAHTPMRLPLLTGLGLAMLAARAARLAILDGVHLDLQDDEGLAASCRQGAELGFDGKTLIHPRQIAAANEAFGPTPDDVAHAHRVVAAHAEAVAEGRGVVVLEGRLVENLHVVEARRTLALAAAIDASGPT